MNNNYQVTVKPSTRKDKKYMVVTNGGRKGGRKIHFGDKGYEQYEDSTGLGLYSHLDHKDKKRRENYFSRHSGGRRTKEAALKFEGKRSRNKLTARFLSHWFLW
jgi:hypothetical protein